MPENIFFHALNLGEIETETLKRLWIQFNEDTNGHPPDTAFQKYSRYRVRKKINQVCMEVVVLLKSLKSWFIIPLKTNYYQYPVPLNCFDLDKVYYFSSATTYSELKLIDEDIIEEELSPNWRTISSTPEFAYQGDWAKMNRKLGIAPPPSADATAITLAATVLSRATPYGPAEAVSGSANPSSGTNIFVDSEGRDFSDFGVIPGLTILNVSDGSRGVITTVSTVTITCSGNLSGGSLNIWTPGDEMRIIGGEYGGFIEIGDTEAEYLLAPNVGQLPLPSITMAAGNLLVRGFMLPTLLVDKNQYPELPPFLHEVLGVGTAAKLAKEEPVDSAEYAQADKYAEEFGVAIASFGSTLRIQYKGDIKMWSKRS